MSVCAIPEILRRYVQPMLMMHAMHIQTAVSRTRYLPAGNASIHDSFLISAPSSLSASAMSSARVRPCFLRSSRIMSRHIAMIAACPASSPLTISSEKSADAAQSSISAMITGAKQYIDFRIISSRSIQLPVRFHALSAHYIHSRGRGQHRAGSYAYVQTWALTLRLETK